jgi:hypothetical protein
MQTQKNAFAGKTANKLKAQFATLKKQHPYLSDRGIYCLIARELKKCGTAIRLGFDTSESEVA